MASITLPTTTTKPLASDYGKRFQASLTPRNVSSSGTKFPIISSSSISSTLLSPLSSSLSLPTSPPSPLSCRNPSPTTNLHQQIIPVPPLANPRDPNYNIVRTSLGLLTSPSSSSLSLQLPVPSSSSASLSPFQSLHSSSTTTATQANTSSSSLSSQSSQQTTSTNDQSFLSPATGNQLLHKNPPGKRAHTVKSMLGSNPIECENTSTVLTSNKKDQNSVQGQVSNLTSIISTASGVISATAPTANNGDASNNGVVCNDWQLSNFVEHKKPRTPETEEGAPTNSTSVVDRYKNNELSQMEDQPQKTKDIGSLNKGETISSAVSGEVLVGRGGTEERKNEGVTSHVVDECDDDDDVDVDVNGDDEIGKSDISFDDSSDEDNNNDNEDDENCNDNDDTGSSRLEIHLDEDDDNNEEEMENGDEENEKIDESQDCDTEKSGSTSEVDNCKVDTFDGNCDTTSTLPPNCDLNHPSHQQNQKLTEIESDNVGEIKQKPETPCSNSSTNTNVIHANTQSSFKSNSLTLTPPPNTLSPTKLSPHISLTKSSPPFSMESSSSLSSSLSPATCTPITVPSFSPTSRVVASTTNVKSEHIWVPPTLTSSNAITENRHTITTNAKTSSSSHQSATSLTTPESTLSSSKVNSVLNNEDTKNKNNEKSLNDVSIKTEAKMEIENSIFRTSSNLLFGIPNRGLSGNSIEKSDIIKDSSTLTKTSNQSRGFTSIVEHCNLVKKEPEDVKPSPNFQSSSSLNDRNDITKEKINDQREKEEQRLRQKQKELDKNRKEREMKENERKEKERRDEKERAIVASVAEEQRRRHEVERRLQGECSAASSANGPSLAMTPTGLSLDPLGRPQGGVSEAAFSDYMRVLAASHGHPLL